jgi:hypothetical protein
MIGEKSAPLAGLESVIRFFFVSMGMFFTTIQKFKELEHVSAAIKFQQLTLHAE